ncbi:hypothetical protein [Tardiphaga sp.]|uniref:hypothetical protein n=1 Tax=Tardiphaga sp. TaxID=1926292 RepID=UPI0037D9C15B
MNMAGKNARNEALKLIANWFNGASLTIAGAGVALPILSRYLDIGTAIWRPELFWNSIVICIGCAVILHLLGQYMVGAIND